MPRTASQLLKATESNRKEKAKYVVLIGVKPGYLRSGAPKLNATAYTTHNADGSPNPSKTRHRVVVYGLNDKERLRDGHVKVSCSCEDFTYTYEVTLHNLGAADIIHSNGDPSDTRNPMQRPGVCCHLTRLLGEVLRAKV